MVLILLVFCDCSFVATTIAATAATTITITTVTNAADVADVATTTTTTTTTATTVQRYIYIHCVLQMNYILEYPMAV